MPPGLFDLHTHFFGPTFYRTLAAAADPGKNPAPGFARLRAAGIEVPADSPEDHAHRWVEVMDRHGVEAMVTFASIPEEAPSVAAGARAAPGRLVPFSLVNPAAPEAAARVAELVDFDMRGLVLFPAMHGYDLSDPALVPFYEAALSRKLPLIVHLGELEVKVRDILGLPTNFDTRRARPEALRGPAEKYPSLQFIVPHFGGITFFETLALGARCPNVAVDTSSSNSWAARLSTPLDLTEVFRRALEVFGPERIHFGSDSSVFPRGWRKDVYEAQTQALDAVGADPETKARILGGNSRRLLGRSQ